MIRPALVCLGLLLLSHPQVFAAGAAAATESSADDGLAGSTAPSYRFAHKTIIIPHDSKIHRGGEDAASTRDDMLVVADGVGGWAKQGIDPGLYSRKLVETITTSYAAMSESERATVDLKRLLHRSNYVAADAHVGSATCTAVRLKDAATLEAVNVGDSGYSIHRRGRDGRLEVAYSSVPGQKAFNFPYQLGGRYGDGVYEPNVTDGPNLHTLESGDVVVLVSDGVNDNMDPEDYHACIEKYQWDQAFGAKHGGYFADAEIVSNSAVADCIARTAYFLGKDKTFQSPFARSAASYGKRWSGGKHDDITVVVAQVEISGADGSFVEREDSHRPELIFLYKISDAPIPRPDTLPTMEEILRATNAPERPAVSSRTPDRTRRAALSGLWAKVRSWETKARSILRRLATRGRTTARKGAAAEHPMSVEL